MKHHSVKLHPEDVVVLLDVARRLGCYYRGRPSWRRLLLAIARGHVRCRPGSPYVDHWTMLAQGRKRMFSLTDGGSSSDRFADLKEVE
jgi:hypothetical protein